MSQTIEDKIVQMSFDNRDFERNVKTSMDTLDSLKKSLDFSGADDSLSGLKNQFSNLNVTPFINGVGQVTAKFSALQVMAISALDSITKKALNTGETLVRSLSVDQLTAGWSKYEEKVASVQTIMSATLSSWEEDAEKIGFVGTQMEYVTAMLNKLNWFSDETSYSFTDMTSSIGKFTSNGVALSEAVTAMEGISTWAALSGQNAQSASRAMYNLAQAISVGAVKLIDWKSIENANMATTEFKQTAIDTAVALGTLKSVGDDLYKTTSGNEVSVTNFNEALSDGWFTSEVLMESLNKYGSVATKLSEALDTMSGDITATDLLSGLTAYKEALDDGTVSMEEMEKIANDVGGSVAQLQPLFEELSSAEYDVGLRAFRAAQEAKTLTDAIEATKDAVSTGWMQTFDLIFGNYEEAKVLFTDLANALWDVFAASGETRNSILELWKDRGGRDELIEGFWNLWDAISNIADIAKEAFDEIFPKTLMSSAYVLLNFTKSIKESTEKFRDFFVTEEGLTDEGEKLKRAFKGVAAALSIVKTTVKGVFKVIDAVIEKLSGTGDWFLNTIASIGDWLVYVDEAYKKMDVFKKISEDVKTFMNVINADFEFMKSAVQSVIDYITSTPGFQIFRDGLDNLRRAMDSFSGANEELTNSLNGAVDSLSNNPALLILASFIETLLSLFNSLATAVGQIANAIGGVLVEALNGMGAALRKGDFDTVFDILSNMLTLFIGGEILMRVNKLTGTFTDLGESINSGIGSISKAIKTLGGSIFNFQQQTKDTVLKNIAVSVLMLAASLVALSMIDPDKLANSISAFTLLITELVVAMRSFSGIATAKASLITSGGIIKLAAAVTILSFALVKIASIDKDKMVEATMCLGMVMGELAATVTAISLSEAKLNRVATGMIAIGVAVRILASSVVIFSELDSKKMWQGVAAVGGILLELATFSTIISMTSPSKMVSTGVGLIALGGAVRILASSVVIFSEIDTRKLINGIAAIGGLLFELATFATVISIIKPSKMISTGAAVVILSAGIKILSDSVVSLGNIEWEKLYNGLMSIGMLLVELAAFTYVTKNSGKMISVGVGLIAVAAAITILSDVVEKFGNMDVGKLNTGLVAMEILILELATFVAAIAILKPEKMLSASVSLLVLSGALSVMADVVSALGSLSVKELVKGLSAIALTLGVMVSALKLISSPIVLVGAAALLSVAASFVILIPQLLILSAFSWEGLAKGLIGFGGALVILTAAGLAAVPAAIGLLSLSAALLSFGATVALIGVGVMALSTGLVTFATALGMLAALTGDAISAIINSIKALLIGIVEIGPELAEAIAAIIVAIANGVKDSVVAIADCAKTVVMTLIDTFVELIPYLSTAILTLVDTLLKSLVQFIPSIVDSIMLLLIEILNGISNRLPELVKAVMNLIGTFFVAIADSLKDIDTSSLVKAAEGLGIVATIMGVAAGLSLVAAEAYVGIAEMGIAIVELTALLTAIGAIAQIPGLDWIVNEAGDFLQNVGEAVGQFVGGIVGGIGEGISSALPTIGTNLSEFMATVQPFLDGAKAIDPSIFDGVQRLCDIVGILTAESLINEITSWMTGGNNLVAFGKEIAEFGPYFKSYADSVSGVSSSVVTSSANAAKALADMAATLPNEGGFISKFTGENSISTFAEELAEFGPKFAEYAKSVEGIDENTVTTSANAAKSLSEMAANLPNHDGIVQFFTGDSSLKDFAEELAEFGPKFAEYANSVRDIDADDVQASANAALALSEMAANLPNEGGFLAVFTGDNRLSDFAEELASFGPKFKEFADSVAGIDNDAVTAVSNSGKALTEVINAMPNQGGVVSWFTGDNTLAKLAEDLASFGPNFKAYADSVSGINSETITASSNAAKSITEIINNMPNQGGVVSWISGDNTLSKLAEDLKTFGPAFAEYASAVSGINSTVVESSSSAAQSITAFIDTIPKTGGIGDLFSGTNNLTNFATNLKAFGPAFAEYANSVSGIDQNVITTSSAAAQSITAFVDTIPENNSIFSNSSNLRTFAVDLASFGASFKSYYDNVKDIDSNIVSVSASAAETLNAFSGALTTTTWDSLTNTGSMSNFGSDLYNFGAYFKSFFDLIKDIDATKIDDNMAALQNVANVTSQSITSLQSRFDSLYSTIQGYVDELYAKINDAATNGESSLATIGSVIMENIVSGISSSTDGIINAIKGMTVSVLDSMSTDIDHFRQRGESWMISLYSGITNYSSYINDALTSICDDAKEILSVKGDFLSSIESFASDIAQTIMDSINDYSDDFKYCFSDFIYRGLYELTEGDYFPHLRGFASDIVVEIVNQINDSASLFTDAFSEMINNGSDIDGIYDQFVEIGENIAAGVAEGIANGKDSVNKAIRALANGAVNSAKDELGIHSPSRVFGEIAQFCILGFTNSLKNGEKDAESAAEELANNTADVVREAILLISQAIEDGIDTEPTIRPVLDLSDVTSKTSLLSSMLGGTSSINAKSIDKSMNGSKTTNTNQNGGNTTQSYVFNQYNTSPKALDRIEIYRQTKNQFSQLRGMV